MRRTASLRAFRARAPREKMNTRRERCVRNRVDTVLLRIIYKTRVVRECVSRDLGRRYYFYELWFRRGSYSLVRGSTSSRQLSRSRDFPSRSPSAGASPSSPPPKSGMAGMSKLGRLKLGRENPPPPLAFFGLGAASSRSFRSNFLYCFGAFFAYLSRTLYV